MSRMFESYDNDCFKAPLDQARCETPSCVKSLTTHTNSNIIHNIKGDALAVEVRRGSPIILHFNISLLEGNPQKFIEQLSTGTLDFRIIAFSRKEVYTVSYPILTVYNPLTRIAKISLTSVESEAIPVGPYHLEMSFKFGDTEYPLLIAPNGYLEVR